MRQDVIVIEIAIKPMLGGGQPMDYDFNQVAAIAAPAATAILKLLQDRFGYHGSADRVELLAVRRGVMETAG